MRNIRNVDTIHRFLKHRGFKKSYTSSISCLYMRNLPTPANKIVGLYRSFPAFETRRISLKPITHFASLTSFRYLNATSSVEEETRPTTVGAFEDSNGEVEPIDLWEEEDEVEPKVGDGGDGGGVVLENCPWGERVLSIAQSVLERLGEDMKLYAFKTSPRGYIYVRLDKLSHEYGCPSMEEIESFSREYKKKLDEVGATGDIPDDLALEVSSPGAERLLKVPDDLLRFRDVPMVVSYIEYPDASSPEKSGVYFLDSIEAESGCCIWKLADVKENREPSAKGRPLCRKQKEWRLKQPYHAIKQNVVWRERGQRLSGVVMHIQGVVEHGREVKESINLGQISEGTDPVLASVPRSVQARVLTMLKTADTDPVQTSVYRSVYTLEF